MDRDGHVSKLIRLPGEYGPVLCCFGELDGDTIHRYAQEIGVLEMAEHPITMVHLVHCSAITFDAAEALKQMARRLRAARCHLIIIAGTGHVAAQVHMFGIAPHVPIFDTYEEAVAPIREQWPRPGVQRGWEGAREEAADCWRATARLLAAGDTVRVMRSLTSMTALCHRAEELRRVKGADLARRCACCPLFDALGGEEQAVGCRSLIDPILEAVSVGGNETALAHIEEGIRLIEAMPLPREGVVKG